MFEDFDDEEQSLERIQHYLSIGAIRFAGYNKDGEAVFELNEFVTKELAPELWAAHMEYVDSNLMKLYEEGLMEVEYDENLEATFKFSSTGYDIAKSIGVVPLNEEDFNGK
jgi:hypothetical protein